MRSYGRIWEEAAGSEGGHEEGEGQQHHDIVSPADDQDGQLSNSASPAGKLCTLAYKGNSIFFSSLSIISIFSLLSLLSPSLSLVPLFCCVLICCILLPVCFYLAGHEEPSLLSNQAALAQLVRNATSCGSSAFPSPSSASITVVTKPTTMEQQRPPSPSIGGHYTTISSKPSQIDNSTQHKYHQHQHQYPVVPEEGSSPVLGKDR